SRSVRHYSHGRQLVVHRLCWDLLPRGELPRDGAMALEVVVSSTQGPQVRCGRGPLGPRFSVVEVAPVGGGETAGGLADTVAEGNGLGQNTGGESPDVGVIQDVSGPV